MLDGELGRGARKYQLERGLAFRMVDGGFVRVAQGAYVLGPLRWVTLYVTTTH